MNLKSDSPKLLIGVKLLGFLWTAITNVHLHMDLGLRALLDSTRIVGREFLCCRSRHLGT